MAINLKIGPFPVCIRQGRNRVRWLAKPELPSTVGGMVIPSEIQVIGNELAVRWSDGQEDYLRCEDLRAHSPSAENTGEPDIFGNWRGGSSQKVFPGVTVTNWEFIGQYAVRFFFSDGHNSGLYTYDYLRKLAEKLRTQA